MTEAEWLACSDPEEMLRALPEPVSERKMRLFACAAVRHLARLDPAGSSLRAVEVAERFADGKAGLDELVAAWGPAQTVAAVLDRHGEWAAAEAAAPNATRVANRSPAMQVSRLARQERQHEPMAWWGLFQRRRAVADEALYHCDLIRDLFGPLPFRSVTLAPELLAWNGGTVGRLARAVYD
jgi:hypothetical protein